MRITVNPDKEFADRIRAAIRANDGYCPCALVKTPDAKCMCKEFLEMPPGQCNCGLYIKKE